MIAWKTIEPRLSGLSLVILLIMGFTIPYYVLQSTYTAIVKAEQKRPVRDTTIVQIANAHLDISTGALAPSGSSQPIDSGSSSTAVGTPTYTPIPRAAKTAAIDTALLGKKWRSDNKPSVTYTIQIQVYTTLALVLIVLISGALLFRYRLPEIIMLDRDRDPEELISLLNDFRSDFKKVFDTPRRMKRFSNKVRFQYTLLEENELARLKKLKSRKKAEDENKPTEEERKAEEKAFKDELAAKAKLMMRTLLLLERDQWENKTDMDDANKTLAWLVQELDKQQETAGNKRIADSEDDKKFIYYIYYLNKEIMIQGHPEELQLPATQNRTSDESTGKA